MNAATKEENLALSPIARAAVALGTAEHEIKLRELAQVSCRILTVTNMDGRDEAHRAAMNLRNARTGITNNGAAAREDANAFSKAVIAEERRLIAIIEPEEKRVLKLRDDFDTQLEQERQAAIAAERKRVDAIQADIATIRDMPVSAAGKPAAVIAAAIDAAEEIDATTERFAEFVDDAAKAIAATTEKLAELHAGAIASEKAAADAKAAAEIEAARIEAERAELAALRAAAAEAALIAKIESDRVAAEQAAEAKRLSDLAAAQAAEALAEREMAAAVAKAELEAQAEANRREAAERDRVNAETKRQLEAKAASIEAERRALDAQRAEMERAKAPAPAAVEAPIASLIELADAHEVDELFPTDAEIVLEIRETFAKVFGLSYDETDARMAAFDYKSAISSVV